MVSGGIFSAALALVFISLASISNVDAGRTHELFSQRTYNEPADVGGPLKDLDNLPEKTATSTSTTVHDSPDSGPQEAVSNTDIGVPQKIGSTTLLGDDTPKDLNQEQQHYRDYRGTTPVQGDFMPDAKPWWNNPQSGNYGYNPQYGNNYVHGGNPELDASNSPNRYPLGYPTRYTGPQYNYYPRSSNVNAANAQYNYYPQRSNVNPANAQYNYYPQSSNVNPSNAQYSTIHNGQYSSTQKQQQQQYFPTQFTQSNGDLPYEQKTGGCPTQYWISNSQRWPAFFTVKTTVGEALGTPASKTFGETTLLQALLNTRPDGYSTLLRSAATAILNSYSRSQYKYTHVNVIESFTAALSSSKAAAEQAASFEEANVSAYQEQYNSCA